VADEKVTYEVAARFTGEGELRRGAAEFDRLADKSKAALSTTTAGGPIAAAGNAWRGMATGLAVASAAFVGVGLAAQQAYATLRAGAELQTTTERFGKLAASIGTTADVMLGKLREATKGMISDAELMASASGIVSLKLADNEEQVVRLATVVGTLGWDMQQVILTFANLSTMRLDALGLSVDEVKQKQKELMDQGMSTAAAFKEAVIQAGEARLDVGGVSESEQAFKKAEAAVTNFKNSLLLSTVATLEQAGAIDAISDAANRMSLLQQLTELDEQARALGLQFDSLPERAIRSNELARSSTSELRSEIILVDNALQANQDSWMRTGDIAVAAMKSARAEARQVAAELNALFLEMTGLAGIELEWAGGIGEGFDYMAAGARAGKDYRSGLAIEARQARIDQNLQFVRHDPDFIASGREVRNEMEYATAATYGYSSALGGMTSAEQEAAAAHENFLSSFNAELRAKPEDGLYNAEGVANVEAVNKALYEQVEAAGASAATLAMLGVATGQFTQEQAEAALKAAVLQEQIRAIAASVAAGDLSIGDALGQLNQAREALDASNLAAVAGTGEGGVSIAVTADTSTAETNLDGTASQLDALTSEEYIATVGMDINAVIEGTTEAGRLISSLPDTKTLTIRWEQSGADVIAALRALGIIV
jgi:cob(I)alamin adenosyltransferase